MQSPSPDVTLKSQAHSKTKKNVCTKLAHLKFDAYYKIYSTKL